MELVEQMPKVETAEFDPIGLFFLLVAVVPVSTGFGTIFEKRGHRGVGVVAGAGFRRIR